VHPERFFRGLLYAQQRGLELHPDLFQYMRQQAARLDDRLRADEHCRDTFLEILSARGNVAPTLRCMHEVGLLGKYLPEFDRLTNLVQHEYFHRYAVDEHTLVCIEKLDRVWQASQPPFDRYAELMRGLERPGLLYFALLLHDCGKAFDTRNHSETGAEQALKVARRLKLDGAMSHTLCLIIEHHLTMVRTAQRFDLEDTSVIRDFATRIQTLENLDLLTLHTFADSMGTSESLWTGFKDSLHWQLYQRTREYLQGSTAAPVVEETEKILLCEEVIRLLPTTYAKDEVEAHFNGMPRRYFQIHTAREISRDLTLAHQFMHLQLTEDDRALEPVIHWHDERDRGHAAVHVCTWDRAGLFSRITGALAAASLNVFGAQIFTRQDSIIFDEFYVADARTGQLPTKEAQERFEKILLQVLTGTLELAPAIAKTKLLRPLWAGVPGDSLPTIVRLNNDAADDRTLIEVETEDRVGLLYAISQALVELRLDLIVAKILTEKGAAIDYFYVTEIGGGKVLDPSRQLHIEFQIQEAIRALN
jgi:[protein-PII] uridylyltransferase